MEELSHSSKDLCQGNIEKKNDHARVLKVMPEIVNLDGEKKAKNTRRKIRNRTGETQTKMNPKLIKGNDDADNLVSDIAEGLNKLKINQKRVRVRPSKKKKPNLEAKQGMSEEKHNSKYYNGYQKDCSVSNINMKSKNGPEFPSYIPLNEVKECLANKSLISGHIRINPKNFNMAFINNPDPRKPDIVIATLRDRNRALEGDLVAVFVKWAEQEGEVNSGFVVHILEKVHSRKAVGTLKQMPDKNREFALFCPRDSKVPRMKIPFMDWPPEFYFKPHKYENVLFLVQITKWTNVQFALGTILENVGMSDDIRALSRAVLLECNLDVTPLPDSARQCYTLLDEVPAEECMRRLDLRGQCVFTIDPDTAKDLDDAVSCRELPDGNLEVGVHISDVTYYMPAGCELDNLVSLRATSIYLAEAVHHMLPRDLCMHCSLLPGHDKLAFSVLWRMTPDGQVLDYEFVRTVINSCVQLSYEHAQAMIEEPGRVFRDDELPPIQHGFTAAQVSAAVGRLQRVATSLRRARFHRGALHINQVKVHFCVDPVTYLPLSYELYENKECHRLIEELMLLANITVAGRLRAHFPHSAFLRCHPPPQMFMLERLRGTLETVGIHLDVSSAGALQRSLAKYEGDDLISQARMHVLNSLCAKTMNRAVYFCSGGVPDGLDAADGPDGPYWHYGLGEPLYTHFTSPIRRYADIMVHRQLAVSLGLSDGPDWDAQQVAAVAKNCSDKKYSAKRAGEKNCEMYLLTYIDLHQPMTECAAVIDVKDQSFEVILLNNGLKCRVYLNSLRDGVKSSVMNSGSEAQPTNNIVIHWPAKDSEPANNQVIALFHIVTVSLKVKDKRTKLVAEIVRPDVSSK